MLRTYHGSCHCGAVTFEADLDLEAGTSRCNCSYCRKVRNWGARTTPDHVRIKSGEADVAGYHFTPDRPIEHCFCRRCGVRLFSRGDVPELGGPVVTISLPALDDATTEELVAAPVMWCDGLNDSWWNPPSEVRHL